MLTIAGSDPSSAAGIARDLAVFTELGCHGLAVLTSMTAQNTSRFLRAEPVSNRMLRSQLDSVFEDFEIGAIKIGMVLESDAIRIICKKLSGRIVPIVVDPVVRSTTGGMLLRRTALGAFRDMLVPMATVITPNAQELAVISGRQVNSRTGVSAAVDALRGMGAGDVTVTGLVERARIYDMVFVGNNTRVMSGAKIAGESRGGGCSYSAALTVSLASGHDTIQAARAAREFALRSLRHATRPGRGLAVASRNSAGTEAKILHRAISELTFLRGVWRLIPECQTNFVFAKKTPKSASDVYGLAGRIVRTGTTVTVAGSVVAGGSRHVASAVLQIAKIFPEMRSAINIRYDEASISAMRKCRMRVAQYDRSSEPAHIRRTEGASIRWGMRQALKGISNPPDAVFHTGAMGKEPMIIVFGRDPRDVLFKIYAVLGRPASPSK